MMKVTISNHDGCVSPVFEMAVRVVPVDVEEDREVAGREEVTPAALETLLARKELCHQGSNHNSRYG